MNTFSLLNVEIQEILGKTFSYLTPTEPQELAIPLLLEGNNVLIIAPTGSGKTEAAVLPVFHKILEERARGGGKEKGFYILYITPLRALNRDMLSRLERWGEELGINIEVRHGDTTNYERRKQALQPPDMLITTPETIQAMLPGTRLRENLKCVRYVIIDEVHELVSSKRGVQLSIALERISELAGNFQRICLSATVGNPEEVAKYFAANKNMLVVNTNTFSTKAIEIEVLSPKRIEKDIAASKRLSVDLEVISHVRTIRDEVKRGENKSSLIFVNTRRAAEMLASLINKLEEGLIVVHHGSLSKEVRIEAEENLKRGVVSGLICTSSMELGIDIGSIDIVIQYASPREVNRLVQRVGRASHFFDRTSRGKIIALSPDDIAESCVIARRARTGKIEDIPLKERSLDVLAHQICGILLDLGEIGTQKLYSLVKTAYPFRNISIEEILRVIEQLEQEGLVGVKIKEGDGNGMRVGRSKFTRAYYYENLSMIPDESKYPVFDIVSGKKICTLDERFVLNFAASGALFVAKGETWRVVDVNLNADADEKKEKEEKKIKVEPCVNKKGEIPNWEGEEIPVPFEVAQEVGYLRCKIDSAEEYERQCEPDLDSLREVKNYIKRQIEAGYPVPTDKDIVVEVGTDEKEVIINACFGHLVNETLGRLITSLLGAKLGTNISMEIDPYRITMKADRRMKKEAIKEILFEVRPEYIQPIIEKTLKNSFLFQWEMLNVAKRFGALRKDFNRGAISLQKLTTIFEGTPIYDETMKGIFEDKLDIERTKEVVKRITSCTGEINVHFSSRPTISPIGAAGYSKWRDVLASEKAESLVIEAVKNRIMNDRVILFCVGCKKWKSLRKVKTVVELEKKSLVCPVCNSRLIAALKPWEKDEIEIVMRSPRPGAEGKAKEMVRVKRVYRNANLVLSHGIDAVIALSARGVGPEAASRIMRKLRTNARSNEENYEFFRLILEEERKYARTKRFWD